MHDAHPHAHRSRPPVIHGRYVAGLFPYLYGRYVAGLFPLLIGVLVPLRIYGLPKLFGAENVDAMDAVSRR
jgi:hypothetical protein